MCLPGCDVCHQNFSYQCDKCVTGLYLFQNQSNTVCSPCNLNSTIIINSSVCVICDPLCDICQTSSTCNLCSLNYFLNPYKFTCNSRCPDGFYSDISSRSCKSCDPQCLKCFGGNNSQCFQCATKYFKYGANCLQNCPLNTIPDQNNVCIRKIIFLKKRGNFTIFFLIFQACTPNCTVCRQNGTTDCEVCTQNYYKFFSVTNTQICVSCNIDGLFILNDTCLNCLTGCKRCVNLATCFECTNGFLYVPIQTICVSTCPDGFYQNLTTCLNCDSKCLKCFGPNSNQCLTCSNGYYQYGSNCLSSCPSNTTNALNQICQS